MMRILHMFEFENVTTKYRKLRALH